MKNKRAFTFIELLIALVVFAIAFVPMLNMFSFSLQQTAHNNDMITARYLAQEGMERLRNLNLTKYQIKEIGDVWTPPKGQAPLAMEKEKWRILRKVNKSTDPLEIHIQVFKEEDLKRVNERVKPVVELVTLFEDFDWAFTE